MRTHHLYAEYTAYEDTFCPANNLSKYYFPTIFVNASRPNPGRREKINLNFYFHTSLWCLKRFYEGLKGLKGTTKKRENKNLR